VGVCDSLSTMLAKWALWNVHVDARIMKAWQMPGCPCVNCFFYDPVMPIAALFS
jgi:hypothetical protein